MTKLTHKEMTAHIRDRLKASKVKASVRMFNSCGVKTIIVGEPKYNSGLGVDGTIRVLEIAKNNGLTTARGGDVNEVIAVAKENNWNHHGFDFEFHG